MTMWRKPFARIIQITTVQGEDVGNIRRPRQGIANRSRWQHEMRIDDVVPPCVEERLAGVDAHRQEGQHREEVSYSLLFAEEYRRAHDPHAFFNALRRQAQALRSQDSHVVALCQFLSEQGIDHPPTASHGGIFIIAEEDAHFFPAACQLMKRARGVLSGRWRRSSW
jgi:hypothetical protein